MGLSKDNIDVIEEIKIVELTGAQKRRLRRKKLKAARTESSETDSDTQKYPVVVNKHSSIPGVNRKEQKSNNKLTQKCESEALNKSRNSISKESTLIINQNSTSENPISSKDVSKINKSTSKDIKKQKLKGEVPHVINNQNNTFECKSSKSGKTPAIETINQICENSVLSKTQKPEAKNSNGTSEKLISYKDLKPSLSKNNITTHNNIQNQEHKGKVPSVINNQNNTFECNSSKSGKTASIKRKKPKSENSVLDNKQKPETENSDCFQQTITVIENKKNKSDEAVLIENRTAVNLKSIHKQETVSQSTISNKNQKPILKKLVDIKNDILNGEDHILIEKPTSEDLIECNSTKGEKSKLEEQEPKQQQIVAIENKPFTLDQPDMGKLQDAQDSQKKQKDSFRKESNKEDTTATATSESAKSREDVKAAREAKKLAKQKAKKKNDTGDENVKAKTVPLKVDALAIDTVAKNVESIKSLSITKPEKSVEPVIDLRHKENIPPTDKGAAIETVIKKHDGQSNEESIKSETVEKSDDKDGGKSKAELRAERRAKQEAQRAAKQAAVQKPAPPEVKDKEPLKSKEEKSPKPKSVDKPKSKTQGIQKVGLFQHLYVEKDKELKNIPINSNLHPAVVKLGVQLETGVVSGSNARCIALLDAIKKMVRDYSLPARTEVARGLQAQLAAAETFLWARRPPSAAETNALKHFRRQLTQLPANVDEFDAKKTLQEEIDRYIREQIDMAGEAISLILRKKISPDDHILTYGCSSLIERVLCSAWAAGVRFRATVVGARGQRRRAEEMLRRLRAHGLPARYVDLAAISYVMEDVQKVVVGAGALLAHGAALGAAGSAQVALVARARNVPVLVACETHKFSERTHLDTLVAHELGDPDELIDKTDEHSPLRDWRSNPRLTLLNVTHDVTPPALITAVVTELGILPCTSAPVVLRFKQSEYGI